MKKYYKYYVYFVGFVVLAVATILFGAGQSQQIFGYICEIVFIMVGLGIFLYGFSWLRKKRLIADIPTSKIRSVAMGVAELSGKTLQKYPLKSLITNTNCVYYKFKIEEERIRGRRGRDWVTIKEGNSTNFFYIEDETGKILVDPLDAEVVLPADYTHIETTGNWPFTRKLRYTEWYITPGEIIYVLGTVKKIKDLKNIKDVFLERQDKIIQRLAQLKQDKEKITQFDIDKNGQLSTEELDIARIKIERELLEEEIKQLSQEQEDDLIIAKGDIEKTFIISDHSEKTLIRELGLKAYSCILIGFCITIAMVVSLLARMGLLPEHLMIPWHRFYQRR